MTVFKLGAFLCVYRARQPLCIEEMCAVLAGWFECVLPAPCAAAPVGKMVSRGWPIRTADQLKASTAGREVARPLLGRIIRMLDQGTRLIDIALMMSVPRLTKSELDGGLDQCARTLKHHTPVPT